MIIDLWPLLLLATIVGGGLGTRYVRRRRKADSIAYRERTDAIIDESLGTWVVESMRARDRRRRRGHWQHR